MSDRASYDRWVDFSASRRRDRPLNDHFSQRGGTWAIHSGAHLHGNCAPPASSRDRPTGNDRGHCKNPPLLGERIRDWPRRLLTVMARTVARRRQIRLLGILLAVMTIAWGFQSRPVQRRQWGATLTVSFYEAVGVTPPSSDEPMRFPQTFDNLEAELLYLRRSLGWETIQPRHLRSVGLLAGEIFRDGLAVSGTPLDWVLTVRSISSDSVLLDFRLMKGDSPLLQVNRLEVHNFETVALLSSWQPPEKSSSAQALKSREKPSAETVSLAVTLTPVITSSSQLRNRPEDLAYPCDEYGRAVSLTASDVFIPPIIIERVVPKFPSRRTLSGTILVEGVITPEGAVTNVRVLRTFDAEMNIAAVDAFRRYRLLPARLNGRPTYAVFREEIRFQAVP